MPGHNLFSQDFRRVAFDFEEFVKTEIGLGVNAPEQICQFYLRGACNKGSRCEFRHTTNSREKAVVCKHWLRGLCKKGDLCEFLHEFNMRKMPECWFYSRYGECSNEDCMYLHIDPESKIKECAWYARGFCKHGPNCRHKHVRKVVCQAYLSGFCPKGPDCPNGHPKYELPSVQRDHSPQTTAMDIEDPSAQKSGNSMAVDGADDQYPTRSGSNSGLGTSGGYSYRPLSEVTCFKCGNKGHFANKCPRGAGGFRVQNGGYNHHHHRQDRM